MTENLLEPHALLEEDKVVETPAPVQPAVPEKFLDPKTGEVRVEALAKSYSALEKKLAEMAVAGPKKPASPEDYGIACPHGFFEPDGEVNKKLFDAGFSPEQAQLVYDLAAERLVPLVMELTAEYHAAHELERLKEHFGGADKWSQASRQILAWGKKNLPQPAFDGLAGSFEGVIAMAKLMEQDAGPVLGKAQGNPALSEDDLRAMIRDPKYWRDKNPAFIKKVEDGYRQLYPQK